MEKSFKRDIDAISHNYSRILFGTADLKKPQKIYASFNIPSDERIMAYIKSVVPFAGPLIVITDCTLYSYLHSPVPFSEICRYLVTQADEKASVVLMGANGETEEILGGSLIAKNSAGIELRQLLLNLQQQLTQQYDWAVEQRDGMVDQIISNAFSQMSTQRIDAATMRLLHLIEQEPRYTKAISEVKAEDIFRTCNTQNYQDYLSGLPAQISQSIQQKESEFKECLLKDLSDKSLDMKDDLLNCIYQNIAQANSLTNRNYLILAYVCARLGKTEQFHMAAEHLRKTYGEAQAQETVVFKEQYYNQRMLKVYQAIQSGNNIPAEWTDWTDSFGLSPLHYALIMNRPSCVRSLLEQKRWQAHKQKIESLADVYDYVVAACILDFPAKEEIIKNCTDLLDPLFRSRKAIERRIKLKEAKIILLENTERKAKDLVRLARKNERYDKVAEMQEKADLQYELRMQAIEELNELKSDLSEIEFEIQDIVNDTLITSMDIARQLRDSEDPFVQYLLRIYANAEFLLHVLTDCQNDYRLYTYQGIEFITPLDVSLDLPYQEYHCGSSQQNTNWNTGTHHHEQQRSETNSDRSQDSAGPIKKPYGNSWFSPEAHRDLKKLREEYRTLAKQYHPDRCKDPQSQEIFQDILNERASILERAE